MNEISDSPAWLTSKMLLVYLFPISFMDQSASDIDTVPVFNSSDRTTQVEPRQSDTRWFGNFDDGSEQLEYCII